MKKSRKNFKTSGVGGEISFTPQTGDEAESRSLLHDPFVHILLLLAVGFIIYFNTMNVPFMFDDYDCLVDSPVIRSFDCFPDTRAVFEYAIAQDLKNNLILRPLAYFTFSVNYALHGLGLFGYHLVNLLLHIGCAMLVYCFSVQLLSLSRVANDGNTATDDGVETGRYLSFFAALLFVCHPLQTQSVTYIVQRFVPLATLFYLAALVLYGLSRGASTTRMRVLTYSLSLAAAVCAMESKEIAFTLPIVIILVEFMFHGGALLPRLVRLIPFILTMAIIPVKLAHLSSSVINGKAHGFSRSINLINFSGISTGDYLMTQFGVITTYLRLLMVPVGQNLDYDYPLQQTFFAPAVIMPLALLLMLVATGFWLLKRSGDNRFYKIIAFGIFWFFITLSVESSIVPIEDLIFEQRAYLPSIGFFISFLAAAAVLFHRVTRKSIARSTLMTCLMLLVCAGLSAATIARNMVWQDDVVFWSDVVKKSPKKSRDYVWLGSALMLQAKYALGDKNTVEKNMALKAAIEKKIDAAIHAYKEAIRLDPKNFNAHLLLAETLLLHNNYDEALSLLATASDLQPTSGLPYAMRGYIFETKKESARARSEYLAAIAVDPTCHTAHAKLADIYIKDGDFNAAIRELEILMRIHPNETVRNNLDQLRKR